MMKFQFAALGVIFGIAAASSAGIAYGTKDTVTFTVTDKERIVESDSDGNTTSKYLIFTDNGTFENTDTVWYFKFQSSDLYGKLKRGQTYEADVYGFRVGWLSMYKNIIDAREVGTSALECNNYYDCKSRP